MTTTHRFGSVALRLALIIPLIGFWLVVPPERSYACSCADPGSPSWALAESAAVFMGRAVSVREFERADGMVSSTDPTTVEFDVSTVWKGSNSPTRRLTTRQSEVSCGFTFVEGVEYVVYSHDSRTVGLCSRTRPLSRAAQDLAALGPGQAPGQGALAPTPDVSVPQTPAVPEPQTPAVSEASGGCGSSPQSIDLAVVGLMAGAVWFGVGRRRSDAIDRRPR